MKKNTLPGLLLLFTLSFGTTLTAQDIIWGGPGDPISEFAGGLEGWTANGVSCDLGVNGRNARWEHSSTGMSLGGFAIPGGRINSPSFSNGVALFDSDWLDNGGDPDNFNGGECPVYHRGELISPVIDLSGQSSVVLRFNQYFRWYLGPGGDEDMPPSSIEVSNNGGNTWTTFIVNESLEFDVPTPTDDVILLDISDVAANQSNVQFKFVFDGDSYFWMIDDVYLLGNLPENDLSMDLHYYHLTAQYIPRAYSDAEAWDFSARISNDGSVSVNDAYLKVQIIDDNDQEVWADSMALANLPVGTEGRVEIADFSYLPEDLRVGQYFMVYTVYQPGIPDATPANNTRRSTFFITDNTFWQSADVYTYSRPDFGGALRPWGWGSFFLTSADTEERFTVVSGEGAVAGEEDENDLTGKTASMYLAEVTSFEVGNQGTTLDDGMTNIVVALADRPLTPADDLGYVTFDLLNFDDEPFVLENGIPYKLLMIVDEGVLIGFDDEYINAPLDLSDGENGTANLYWDEEFIGGNFIDAMPALVLNLSLVTSTDERPLPDGTVQVYPNPADNFTTVDIRLERAQNVTVTLADIHGRVIQYQNVTKIKDHRHFLDLTGLSNGNYIVRVASPDGTSTHTISVVK